MFDSKQYWETRYKTGGNSGCGSYGRLAKYKANFINRFIEEQNISTIGELGCGDGNQLSLLNKCNYVGYDISPTIITNLRRKFIDDLHKNFIWLDDKQVVFQKSVELALSLDVIFHLIEDDVFNQYMHNLFTMAKKYVIIYSSNDESLNELKNPKATHVRHRCFTDWIKTNYPQYSLIYHETNQYPFDLNDQDNTSFSDFFVFELNKNEYAPIVTLTTTSERISGILPVITSIINQKLKPRQLIINLSQEGYLLDQGIPQIPNEISRYLRLYSWIKVLYGKNTGSYRKLLPVLDILGTEQDNLIVTADDDTIYPPDWLHNLYTEYKKEGCIIAYRGKKMRFENEAILPYDDWSSATDQASILNFATGKDGIIYNAKFFHSLIKDTKLPIGLCDTGDDIWFKWLTTMKGIKVKIINQEDELPSLQTSKDSALFLCINKDKNDEMIEKVHDFFKKVFNFNITALDHSQSSRIHKSEAASIGIPINNDGKKEKNSLTYLNYQDTWKQAAQRHALYIFGTGQAGRLLYQYLKEMNIEPEGFFDNNADKWETTFCGLNIVNPKTIHQGMFIIIASSYYLAIAKQLRDSGLMEFYDFDANYPLWFNQIAVEKLK